MTRLENIASLRKELAELGKVPHLTAEDHEDISDRYQDALEIGYERDRINDEIKSLEAMKDSDYDDLYIKKIHEDVCENCGNPEPGGGWCLHCSEVDATGGEG